MRQSPAMVNWNEAHKETKQQYHTVQAKMEEFEREVNKIDRMSKKRKGEHIKRASGLETEVRLLLTSYKDRIDDLEQAVDNSRDRKWIIIGHFKEEYSGLQRDFRKVGQRLDHERNRNQLFTGDYSRNRNRDELQLLIKEQSSVNQSGRLASEIVGQARAGDNKLTDQERIIQRSRNFAKSAMNAIPQIKQLMTSIKRFKQRDMVITSCTIATCIILIFLYWINK